MRMQISSQGSLLQRKFKFSGWKVWEISSLRGVKSQVNGEPQGNSTAEANFGRFRDVLHSVGKYTCTR